MLCLQNLISPQLLWAKRQQRGNLAKNIRSRGHQGELIYWAATESIGREVGRGKPDGGRGAASSVLLLHMIAIV